MSTGTSSKCCSACGVELTDENGYRRKTGKQAGQFLSRCRSCDAERYRHWCSEHPGYMLKRRYGITAEEYEARYIAEDGRCAICRKQCEVLCIDHDHATGRIRGLLCSECNVGIGMLGDNLVRLSRACTYIERGLYATSRTALRPRQHAA